MVGYIEPTFNPFHQWTLVHCFHQWKWYQQLCDVGYGVTGVTMCMSSLLLPSFVIKAQIDNIICDGHYFYFLVRIAVKKTSGCLGGPTGRKHPVIRFSHPYKSIPVFIYIAHYMVLSKIINTIIGFIVQAQTGFLEMEFYYQPLNNIMVMCDLFLIISDSCIHVKLITKIFGWCKSFEFNISCHPDLMVVCLSL